ncbi:MAG: hypothetical protein L0Y43_01235 [Methylococcaceae bacterium]|nr:hypothetical protein [Methylococcaceae bacterium]
MTVQIPVPEGYTYQAIQAGLTVYRAIQQEIQQLEQSAFDAVQLSDEYKILQTAPGIGKILGLTALCWKPGIFIVLQDPATTHRIVVVSTATGAATARRKAVATRKPAIPVYPGLFPKRLAFCGPVSATRATILRAQKSQDQRHRRNPGGCRKTCQGHRQMMLKHQQPYEAKLMFPG